MMASISSLGRSTDCFLLVLVFTGISILPPAWCQYCNTVIGEPRINISSTPPSNKLSIGAAINLTCIAWQTEQLAKDPRTKPYRIEWFDPQDKEIGSRCTAGWPPTRLMKCTLEVGALTEGKLGNYTCRARTWYNYCSTKKFHICPQESAPSISSVHKTPANFKQGGTLNLHCQATATCSSLITYEWFATDFKGNSKDMLLSRYTLQPNTGKLTISTLNHTQDDGFFYCVAANAAGKVRSARLVIRVGYLEAFPNAGVSASTSVLRGGKFNYDYPVVKSFPKPTITWTKSGGALSESQRISFSAVGNLYIGNVDVNDAGNYESKVENTVTGQSFNRGTISLGVNVRNPGSIPSTPCIILGPTNQVAIKGTTSGVTFECFVSGRPMPTISWWKGGQQISQNATFSFGSYKKRLTVLNPGKSEEGFYECQAINSSDNQQISRRANLTIIEKPSFTVQPAMADKYPQESVVFKCNATGSPKPQISWFHNGQKVAPSNVGRIQINSKNELKFTSLQSGDKGTVQCFATNDAGEAISKASLNVIKTLPVWIDVPPKNTDAIVNETVELQCQGRGSPTPTITWQKNDQNINFANNPRFFQKNTGSLQISRSQKSDSGNYTCVATNSLGSKRPNATLRVLIKTVITAPLPSQIQATKGLPKTLPCTVQKDPDITVKWTWTKDGSSVDKARMTVQADGSLRITTVQEIDAGTYTCRVESVAGNAATSGTMSVQETPPAPSTPVVSDVQTTSVRLSWFPPGYDGNSPITSYNVYAKKGSNNWDLHKDDINPSNRQMSVTLRNLSPHTQYQFHVRAVNSVGEGTPSGASEVIRTLIAAPSAAPLNVNAVPTSADSILVTWQLPPPETHNGPLRGFKIAYRLAGVSASTFIIRKIENSAATQGNIDGLVQWTSYEIKVLAYNDAGDGTYSSPITVTTSEGATKSPEFVNAPVNQTAFLGSNVTFNCTASGYPKPTITWAMDNDSNSVQYNSTAEMLTGDGNSIFSQLAITDVKSKNYGTYHCVANNSAGIKISSATLARDEKSSDAPSVEGTKGPLAASKRKNPDIIAITVPLSVAIVILGGVSVYLQYFRGRCYRNQTYDNKNPEQDVTLTSKIQEEDQFENTYDYIDNSPSSVAPREHKEVQLSGHSPEENPLLGTSGADSPVKRPPQARPLPPIPQIEKERQKMEENSEHNVTCLRMLQSETQNPNFQTPDEGYRGNILGAGQDIPLDIEKNTCLTAVWQETEEEPWLLPARGSMSETEAETKPMLSALGVDLSHGEPPNVGELLPTADFEAAPPRPPKPTKQTKDGAKYNEISSINSREIEVDYEIDLKRLEVRDEVLGEGEFGIVYKGRYYCKDNTAINVAVKQLKGTAEKTDKVALLSEIQMLKRVGRHPNIVNLVGACTQGENILLVTDLIPGGTLESLLTSKPAPGEHGKYENVKCALNDRELIKIALQIASGMQHLASKKCIHGDLAARNVFIDENSKAAKLGDFGLARDISDRGIYNKTSNGRVPWRWLSLESLTNQVYTSQSDVWSFGILLWEIATFGKLPYPDIATPWALKSFLSSGRRMPRPDHCTEELYELMQSCWMENPLMRPTFEEITKRIKYLLRKVKKSYMNVQHDDITDDSETF